MSADRPPRPPARDPRGVSTVLCPWCGAPAPVGKGDQVHCAYCGAVIEAPKDLKDLRAAEAEDAAARRDAERLLATLDRPPWLITEFLAAALDLRMFSFLVVFGVPVGIGSILAALAAGPFLARVGHYRSADDVPGWITMALVCGCLVVLTFVPRVVGVYAGRRATARKALVRGLSARFPRGPGGAAECRNCGAPLTIPEGAVVVTCRACHADNAVRLRMDLVGKAQDVARLETRSVADAARVDAEERSETRKKLWSELGRYLLRGAIAGALVVGYAIDDDKSRAAGGSGAPVLGILCLTALVFTVIYWVFRSAMADDGEEARARSERARASRVPPWAGAIGAILVAVLLMKGLGLLGRILAR